MKTNLHKKKKSLIKILSLLGLLSDWTKVKYLVIKLLHTQFIKWFPSHFCGTFFLFFLPLRKDSRCAVICVKGNAKKESTILKKEASNAKPPNMYRRPKIIRFKCFISDFLKIKRMFICLLGLYLGRECCWWEFQFFASHQSINPRRCMFLPSLSQDFVTEKNKFCIAYEQYVFLRLWFLVCVSAEYWIWTWQS